MSRVTWSRRATADLQRLAEFTRQYSPAKETELVTKLVNATEQLEQFPHSAPQYRLLPDGSPSRSLVVGKHHRLIYGVDAQDNVTILQVLDTRSDNP